MSLRRSSVCYRPVPRACLTAISWLTGQFLHLNHSDSRLDLLERRLKAQSHRLKQAAAELIPRGLRTPRGTPLDPDDDSQLRGGDEQRRNKYKIDPEKEVERLRIKVGLSAIQYEAMLGLAI
jgi:hypothetical protein